MPSEGKYSNHIANHRILKMENLPIDNRKYPQTFLQRMERLLGSEYQDFIASLHQPATIGLRVNTLKLSSTEFSQRSPYQLSPIPWCSSGFSVEPAIDASDSISPGKHPYHAAGLYYMQEPSAMAAVQMLAPQPGERVLDLCAAPGGKATHLAALMKNKGLLVTNEIHPKRVWALAENLERCGVRNAVVVNENPQRLAEQFEGFFDRVLLDAPCSGEGMFRKAEVARREWKPELLSSCSLRQSGILEHASRMVKQGGYLAYTTCTFSPEENESVIATFLANHSEFDLLAMPRLPGFQPARPEWVGLTPAHKVNRAIRIWPHLSQGEGHFIALLLKHASSNTRLGGNQIAVQAAQIHLQPVKTSKLSLPFLDEFLADNFNLPLDDSRLVVDGTYVYYIPEIKLDLSDIRVIHPGWWLGTIKKKRFVPSHSLAMGIRSGQVKNGCHLQVNDPQLKSYLAGEVIPGTGENSWILITLEGYPLGWGKRVNGLIKNYYPRGLRKLN
jgi:NOL1/NOP2/sun family putative RNA methylase